MTAQRHRPGLLWLPALPFALAMPLQPQVSAAAEYQTAAAGGGGGNSFALRCANDQVLVGVGGRASAMVDEVEPLCAQVDPPVELRLLATVNETAPSFGYRGIQGWRAVTP